MSEFEKCIYTVVGDKTQRLQYGDIKYMLKDGQTRSDLVVGNVYQNGLEEVCLNLLPECNQESIENLLGFIFSHMASAIKNIEQYNEDMLFYGCIQQIHYAESWMKRDFFLGNSDQYKKAMGEGDIIDAYIALLNAIELMRIAYEIQMLTDKDIQDTTERRLSRHALTEVSSRLFMIDFDLREYLKQNDKSLYSSELKALADHNSLDSFDAYLIASVPF